jgi:hypothetical protein
MQPMILRASEEAYVADNAGAEQLAQTQTLFPFDEKLEEALCKLVALVNEQNKPEIRAAFGEMLNYVDMLEREVKRQFEQKSKQLTWTSSVVFTLNEISGCSSLNTKQTDMH